MERYLRGELPASCLAAMAIRSTLIPPSLPQPFFSLSSLHLPSPPALPPALISAPRRRQRRAGWPSSPPTGPLRGRTRVGAGSPSPPPPSRTEESGQDQEEEPPGRVPVQGGALTSQGGAEIHTGALCHTHSLTFQRMFGKYESVHGGVPLVPLCILHGLQVPWPRAPAHHRTP